MKVHDKIKEEPVGPLHCPTCQKSFEIKKYLTAHMKTHLPKDNNEENKEKKKCNTCSFETISSYKLQRHLKTHEKNVNDKVKSGKKNKVCDICSFATNRVSTLKKHLNTHKPNTLPTFEAKCGECGKCFNNKKSFKAHETIHTKVNLVNCKLCDKSFSKKGNLLAHMKSIHQSKKVKTNLGFGRWEDHGKNNKETMKSFSFCDYVSKHASNL